MKEITSVLAIFVLSATASAQSIHLAAGKRMSVITQNKTESSTTVMGQQMDLENTITNFQDYEIKAVTDTSYTISNTLKRVKASIAMSGQEQSFDSDDEASRNDPQLAELFGMLNTSNEIEVGSRGTITKGDIGTKVSQMGLPANVNDQSKFVLLQQQVSKLKTGNQWSDSTVSEGNRIINEYAIGKTDDTTAEMLVKSTFQLNITLKQLNMDVKQSMQGTMNTKRLYNKVTGLLIKEESELALTGTMEIMGQSSPMDIKSTITTTVN